MVKRSVAAIIGLGIALSACSGLREHKGFVIDPALAEGIQVGVDNKDSVVRTMGRPTFTGQFDPNDWYYVSRDTTQLAFRDPKVMQQTVLRVQFDQAGNVSAVQKTGKETIIFSCLNQDQPMDQVDFKNLNTRLQQNTVQEKLSCLWLDYLLAD